QQDRLVQTYGALSFPIVVAGDKYVGGFTHILMLHASKRLSDLTSEDPATFDALLQGKSKRDSTRTKRQTGPPPKPDPVDPEAHATMAALAAWGEHLRKKEG